MNDMRFENLSIAQELPLDYDLLVAALGYESRAISVASELARFCRRCIAIGFSRNNEELSYPANKSWFIENKAQVFDKIEDEDFADKLTSELAQVVSRSKVVSRIAIDISCLNRYRLACAFAILIPMLLERRILVDVWYSLASFQPPRVQPIRNEVVGPIHAEFAGWFSDPGRPLAMIAGLGYEQGKIMGATEYLQASRVIAFSPISPIAEYEGHVETANRTLLRELGERDVIRYLVSDPARTLAILDSSIRGLEETHNVVILPLGPKIFTVSALLAQRYHSEASVWRVSSGRHDAPRDIKPSGHLYGLGIRFD